MRACSGQWTNGCTGSMHVTIVRAWMLGGWMTGDMDVAGMGALAHGCTGIVDVSSESRGHDALANACTWNVNVVIVPVACVISLWHACCRCFGRRTDVMIVRAGML